MNNLNSILIEGNLVRDPMLRSTPKGTPVCTFSLASNRYYKQDSGQEREVSFFDVETWAKLAESCYSLGHKGRGVRVVGRLKQDRWNGSDGKPHSRVTIVAEHVEFRQEFKRGDPYGEGPESFAGNLTDPGLPETLSASSAGYREGTLQEAGDYAMVGEPEAVTF
ncbi:MAG: single-stranded DNA-binding protein [Spirochaetaceae bacterium]|nr:single-stranded DNA-binding protein [Spirochaetaceae bacterium]